MKKFIKSMFSRERFSRVTLPIILVIILVVIGLFTFQKPVKSLSVDEAKTRAEKFINGYLMQGGNKATVKEVTTEYGLYKLKVDIVSDVIESYLMTFTERLIHLKLDYQRRKRSFDTLFKHRPRDEHGSFAYRWECILDRLNRIDPSRLAEAIRKQFPI